MPPKVKMPPKQFALTRWLCDESVGVMPFSALRKKDQVPYVGAFVEMKYLGKFYDAEILKISGTCMYSLFSMFSLLADLVITSPLLSAGKG